MKNRNFLEFLPPSKDFLVVLSVHVITVCHFLFDSTINFFIFVAWNIHENIVAIADLFSDIIIGYFRLKDDNNSLKAYIFTVSEIYFPPFLAFSSSLFVEKFKRVTSYFIFIVAFTAAVGTTLVSNEYLLFCCIIFTLFYFFDTIVTFADSFFESGVAQLRQAIVTKFVAILAVVTYQQGLVKSYQDVCEAFEISIAVLDSFSIDIDIVDDIVFECDLTEATFFNSLNLVVSQIADDVSLELLEECEINLVQLDDICTTFEYTLLKIMLEIYNFFIYFTICLAVTALLTFGVGQLTLFGFDAEKFSAYECGFDPFEHTRFGFDIRFYLVAIFYIIFDLEVIFFFPLTLNIAYFSAYEFVLVISFIFFLFIGIVYEFWYGKLDWS